MLAYSFHPAGSTLHHTFILKHIRPRQQYRKSSAPDPRRNKTCRISYLVNVGTQVCWSQKINCTDLHATKPLATKTVHGDNMSHLWLFMPCFAISNQWFQIYLKFSDGIAYGQLFSRFIYLYHIQNQARLTWICGLEENEHFQVLFSNRICEVSRSICPISAEMGWCPSRCKNLIRQPNQVTYLTYLKWCPSIFFVSAIMMPSFYNVQ